MARILIIDDDTAFRETLAETLSALGHTPLQSNGDGDPLEILDRSRVDLIVLDYRMPNRSGVSVLAELRSRFPSSTAPVIMLTAFASAQNTIEAMRLGAFDHLEKPIRRDAVRELVDRALRRGATPTESPLTSSSEPGALVGNSAQMRSVQKMIGMAAASDASVLIGGETGTGKELIARLLHDASARASGPFVAVNCAAIPADLLESELFGHVRGAFTGASSARKGSFREADGGTLFLDEIGDMPLSMQAKILRALQEQAVTPVGADAPLRVNVRVVAATHRDLQEMVRQGQFRQDLFYRLAVIPIAVPALRERGDDIVSLANHFLQQSKSGRQLSAGAIEKLRQYSWPGNVRELRNAIERTVVTVRGATIEREDLDFLPSESVISSESNDASLTHAVEQLERNKIAQALLASKGNRSEAARALGIHRQLLLNKIKRYGLESS